MLDPITRRYVDYRTLLREAAFESRWDHVDLEEFVSEITEYAAVLLRVQNPEESGIDWLRDGYADRWAKNAKGRKQAATDARKCCEWVWKTFDYVPDHSKDRPGAVAFIAAGGEVRAPKRWEPDRA